MASTAFRKLYDQMGCEVTIPRNPTIISLVPSQTELLFSLGLEGQIVGITKFCVHPGNKVKAKRIVGGTKRFRLDVIDKLKPQLIIGNKEENYMEGIKKLREKYPVWMSDIYTFDDALDMIKSVGIITDKAKEASGIINKISVSKDQLTPRPAKRTLYFIWKDPYMVAGNTTFINEMINLIGLQNMADHLPRYPKLTLEGIKKIDPELILLSSEPFPFREKHIKKFNTLFPSAKTVLVDGEMFSWYGSRMIKAFNYFNHLQF